MIQKNHDINYHGIVTRIKNLRKHPNANKLQIGECLGNTVCVTQEFRDNQIGIYFPAGCQLSSLFATENLLLRETDLWGDQVGGLIDPHTRHVKAINIRGERSDGLFVHIYSLLSFGDVSGISEGDIIEQFNGHHISNKYVPNKPMAVSEDKIYREYNDDISTMVPHYKPNNAPQYLYYNLHKFKPGDIVEVSLKLHGSSGSTSLTPIACGRKKRNFKQWITGSHREVKYKYDMAHISKRKVVSEYDVGSHGSEQFRINHGNIFSDKIHKGETVYYEIVGYVNGIPIVPTARNAKVQLDGFNDIYGDVTTFSYGCEPDESRIYVYRMTMTNDDGYTIEYSPAQISQRCLEIGVERVPIFTTFIVGEDTRTSVLRAAEKYYSGSDPIDNRHIREGVVLRILNRDEYEVYKHTNHIFKVIESISKEDTKIADIDTV